ncbi:MAG: 50S ribosomal protein L4 [Clostridia bacterium]|nr:50S ribosomal protein L4 [Clostridia bacterium]
MPKVALYNMKAEQIGEVELNELLFGSEVNVPAMHMMVKNYLAAQRQGTQSALTRGEVSGGGKKPWRQKGTGRARQGSTRAPQWTHGGVVFAPKPRSYRFRVNKKLRKTALYSALSSRAASGDVIVIDDITVDEYKTKTVVSMLKAFGVDNKALIVTEGTNDKLVRSARNIPGVSTSMASNINTYSILLHNKLILTKAALAKLEEVYA